MQNTTYTENRFGTKNSALRFNSGYIRAPSGIYFGNYFTVLAWVKLNNYAKRQRLFDFGNGRGNANVFFTLSDTENNVQARIYNNEKDFKVETSHLDLNTWYHIVLNVRGNRMGIFVNGTRKILRNMNFFGAESVARVNNYFGRSNWYFYESNAGQYDCDEIKFFNKSLDDIEIKNEYDYGYH